MANVDDEVRINTPGESVHGEVGIVRSFWPKDNESLIVELPDGRHLRFAAGELADPDDPLEAISRDDANEVPLDEVRWRLPELIDKMHGDEDTFAPPVFITQYGERVAALVPVGVATYYRMAVREGEAS